MKGIAPSSHGEILDMRLARRIHRWAVGEQGHIAIQSPPVQTVVNFWGAPLLPLLPFSSARR